ncbi:disulfide bond formation protein DsbA [Candidatus Woesearchaeota archaeon CG10_big_fil_rev_8_21_14_0_10_32_24]|nr:MAG: disulfide bond formation protein DsbA [Candidatus Woesearchaeota archaeon CG10_big_fil_rev_8_21_14_0_10_32_24]
MKKVLFVVTLLAVVLFIAGCTGSSKVVCNEPYIQVGSECCLDQNSNKICDSDEGGAAAPEAPAPLIDMASLLDDDAVKGDVNAPVTIVEWSDYECPFCGRFYSETFGQIDNEYIKTEKVKLIVRDFPLSFHTQAQKAAEAAECAGDQGKYYEMHNLLFEKGVTGGVAGFKGYAKELGLNTAKFDSCLDSGEKASETANDMSDGAAAGIQGTPGFVIGPSDGKGIQISGAQPFAVFKQVIDAVLAE